MGVSSRTLSFSASHHEKKALTIGVHRFFRIFSRCLRGLSPSRRSMRCRRSRARPQTAGHVASLEEAKDHAFTPPPKAWIESRVTELTDLLEQRTERSALAFRRLAGPVVLTPKKPDIGKAYYQASCKVDALNLLACEDAAEGSSLLRWWSRGESNRLRQPSLTRRHRSFLEPSR